MSSLLSRIVNRSMMGSEVRGPERQHKKGKPIKVRVNEEEMCAFQSSTHSSWWEKATGKASTPSGLGDGAWKGSLITGKWPQWDVWLEQGSLGVVGAHSLAPVAWGEVRSSQRKKCASWDPQDGEELVHQRLWKGCLDEILWIWDLEEAHLLLLNIYWSLFCDFFGLTLFGNLQSPMEKGKLETKDLMLSGIPNNRSWWFKQIRVLFLSITKKF